MLVIHYDPHDGDVVPDAAVSSFVKETIEFYRGLPPTENNLPSRHTIYIGSTSLMKGFVDAILAEDILVSECCIIMGRRQVYFLFLKNLFSECPSVSHEELAVIFQNSSSSFASLG
ncbi:hypothetical protein D3C75_1066230 [compost metagenome]